MRAVKDQPVLDPPTPTADAASRMTGATTPPATAPLGLTEVARPGPTISLIQLEPDHALVVVRGEVHVEFLLGLRQHLGNLVDAGVRYVVVDLAELTTCPPQLLSELAATCRALHTREGWLRSIASAPCVATALESAAVDDLFPIYRAAQAEFRVAS
jgi:anti-anti-sigma regulatory factor